MKISLTIIAVWSAMLCAVSALLTLASVQNYAVTLPFFALSGCSAALGFRGMRSPAHGAIIFWLAALPCGLLFFPYMFAMSRWSGGESTAGYMWQVLLGIGSLLAGALAVVLAVVVIVLQVVNHAKRAEPGAPPNRRPARHRPSRVAREGGGR